MKPGRKLKMGMVGGGPGAFIGEVHRKAACLDGGIELVAGVSALMHNYAGYPMVKLARDLVRQNELGKIRKVVVRYSQGWLATPLERTGQKQACWRCDPKQSGAGCVGDIGTHAANLAEYITSLKIKEVCAELTTFVKGRKVDDDISCLLRFSNGARGLLGASQICIGEENGLAIWVYGEQKSLEWHQEHPNCLYVKEPDGPVQLWQRGNNYVAAKSPAAARATRLPQGHPEAFLEAFANVYCNFADTIRAKLTKTKPDKLAMDFPDVEDGLRGMLFIDAVLTSAKNRRKWTKMRTPGH